MLRSSQFRTQYLVSYETGWVPRASKKCLFRIRALRRGTLTGRCKRYGINAKVAYDENVRGLDQDSFVFRRTS